jgi:cell division protein ZapB
VFVFGNYSAWMDMEIKSLENKIEQFVEVCQRLRADNQQLRQELASAITQSKRLEEKINMATARLEMLLSQIPAEDTQ